MNVLTRFQMFTDIVTVLIGIMYAYQFIYMIISFIKRRVPQQKPAQSEHRFAIFTSARNESEVIPELLESLKKQNYPKDKYDIYVVADNCTDNTAEVSRKHGAVVFERFNEEEKGKGYALNYLYHNVTALKGNDYYDAYVVFDADNIVDKNFLREANKKLDTGKYDAFTTYRNTKNFSNNWISAAYSIWFMHEARHLNYVRDLIGAQAMISGTGYVVTSRLMEKNNGWPFYLLTEDIQFSVDATINDYRIGYCDSAMLYDEQPVTMKQSWNQRLRWAKGFYQIDARYLLPLTHALFTKKKEKKLGCYDVLMTAAPASLLTVAMLFASVVIVIASAFMPYYVRLVFIHETFGFIGKMLAEMWLGSIALGAFTVAMEWNRIPATNWQKIKYLPMFPMYMLTYIPITIQALFVKVQWTPIKHYTTAELAEGVHQ